MQAAMPCRNRGEELTADGTDGTDFFIRAIRVIRGQRFFQKKKLTESGTGFANWKA